ncbi:hypothetical protein NJB1507_48770 [Mycobacterium marinum]|uniref:Uncharacterized protein n=1 Tax=Mycobacterium pseudoshottsii TaxID=265949 RepID=A0A9N7QMJ2_9MYCO|nr:hypothetical protein MPSD_06910 [Mycobacterium pseudoshottsii JCM 15466]BDN80469.1 hypothetical protein NJB1907Z4_C06840 [Mycobacterium pseudoshottsii]GJO35244.1 hypothetical protein NJB1507_48770 [Mycobacterium marinum]
MPQPAANQTAADRTETTDKTLRSETIVGRTAMNLSQLIDRSNSETESAGGRSQPQIRAATVGAALQPAAPAWPNNRPPMPPLPPAPPTKAPLPP